MSSSLINRVEVKLSSIFKEDGKLDSQEVRKKEESRFLYENYEDNPNLGEVKIDFDDYFTLHFTLSRTGSWIQLGDIRTAYKLTVAQMLDLLRREYGADDE